MGKIAVVLLIALLLVIPVSTAEMYKLANVRVVPEKIDRRTATLTAVPIQIQTLLTPLQKESAAKIIATKANCASEDIIDGYVLRETTRTPIIVLKLMADTEKEAISINCTMKITLLQNNQTTTEEKQISKNVELYKNPLGEIDENIQQKIDAISTDIDDFDKTVTRLQKTNKILGQAAAYAEKAAVLDATNTFMLGGLWAAMSVLEEIPYTKAAAQNIWKSGAPWQMKNHEMVLWTTWNPGLGPTGTSSIVSSFVKTLTIIQSCQLCDYSNSYTALIEQSAGKKIFTLDDKQGKPTVIQQFLVYEWKPYKSIHVAQACQCIPAISYNIQKERQIKCIYKKCIEQNAEMGLPITECDKTLKQQQCLYVDGAAWKVSGGNGIAPIFSQITNRLFREIDTIARSAAWQYICDYDTGTASEMAYPSQYGVDGVVGDFAVPMCAVTAGLQMLDETGFFKGNRYKWDQYIGDLQGEDYC